MPVVSMRFFNVYGVRHRTSGTYGAVFGVFLAQLLNNKPLTIVGDGEQTRDFTYLNKLWEETKDKDPLVYSKELGQRLSSECGLPISSVPFDDEQSHFFKQVYINTDRVIRK